MAPEVFLAISWGQASHIFAYQAYPARQKIQLKYYLIQTEEAYASWVKRYILFHGRRHPKEISRPEVEAYLTHLATVRQVSASTQGQAFSALLFLYNKVLELKLERKINACRANLKFMDQVTQVLRYERHTKELLLMDPADSASSFMQTGIRQTWGTVWGY